MLDWNKVDTVFLDMDGTLLDLHYDNHFWLTHLPQRVSEIQDIPLAQVSERLQGLFAKYHGSLNWYCLDFWSEELGLDLVPLKREVRKKIAYRPSARAFLEFINAHSYDIALVTNAHPKVVELKLAETDLGDYLPEIISSHDYGLPKERVEFWQALQAKRAFDPERTAFFDDNLAVLASAASFGIAHLIAIAKPDSQQAGISDADYPLLHDFMDILPGATWAKKKQ